MVMHSAHYPPQVSENANPNYVFLFLPYFLLPCSPSTDFQVRRRKYVVWRKECLLRDEHYLLQFTLKSSHNTTKLDSKVLKQVSDFRYAQLDRIVTNDEWEHSKVAATTFLKFNKITVTFEPLHQFSQNLTGKKSLI